MFIYFIKIYIAIHGKKHVDNHVEEHVEKHVENRVYEHRTDVAQHYFDKHFSGLFRWEMFLLWRNIYWSQHIEKHNKEHIAETSNWNMLLTHVLMCFINICMFVLKYVATHVWKHVDKHLEKHIKTYAENHVDNQAEKYIYC